MARKKTPGGEAPKGLMIEGLISGSPDDMRRLRELIESGEFARLLAQVPVENKDGTLAPIGKVEISLRSPGSSTRGKR